ncbi:hypothetical protein BDF14DRAFT_1749585, partial [Spinellus fusiger]
MHEDSTVENKRTYRYTSNQSAVENKSRKFRKLRENLKPDAVKAAELPLSGQHLQQSIVKGLQDTLRREPESPQYCIT